MNHLISTLKPNHPTVRISGVVLATLFLLAIAIAAGAGTVAADQQAPAFELADYADEEGVVETDGLREAISDWRAGEITVDELRAVIDAWRTNESVVDPGDPVDEEPVDEDPADEDPADAEPADLSIEITDVRYGQDDLHFGSFDKNGMGPSATDLDTVEVDVEVTNAGGETDTRVGISSVEDIDGDQILETSSPVDRKVATDGGFTTTLTATVDLESLIRDAGTTDILEGDVAAHEGEPTQIVYLGSVTVGVGDDLTSPDDTDTFPDGGPSAISSIPPVVNIDQATGYFDIQPAVDEANEDETILVRTSYFNPYSEVAVDVDGLTIEGIGEPKPEVGTGIFISADDVTVDGFETDTIVVVAFDDGFVEASADTNDFGTQSVSTTETQFEPVESVSGVSIENNDVSLVGVLADGGSASVSDVTVLDNSFEGEPEAPFRVVEFSQGDELALDFREVFDENEFDRGVATFDPDGEIRPGAVEGGVVGLITTEIQPHFDQSESGFGVLDNGGASSVAQPGDTTEVAPGTYEENVEIGVEDVTLESVAGAAETTIVGDIFVGSEGGGSSNPTSADSVVIDGFEIVEPGLNGDGQGIGVTESSDVVIQNNEFEGFRTQISLDFAGGDVENITIQDNSFANVGEGDAEVGTAIGATENADGLAILNNEFINNRNDIGLASSTTDVTIEDNSFEAGDSESYISNRNNDDPESATILAENTFDPDAVTIEEFGGDPDRDQIVPETAVNVVNVDQQTGFFEIQPAVDGADDGDRLEVRPGTYEESVSVGVEGLTLEAADGAEPTIEQDGDTIVTVTADDVEVDGLTLQQQTIGAGDGIRLEGDGFTLEDSTVLDTDIGLETDNTADNVDLVVRDSEFRVTERTESDGTSGYAFGDGDQDFDAATGVFLQDAPGAEIENTLFTGWKTGVTIEDATDSPGVTVTDSTFDENRNGIGTGGEGADTDEADQPTIEDNIFKNTEVGYISNRVGLDSQEDLIDQNTFEADDESFSGVDIGEDFDPTPVAVGDEDEEFVVPTGFPGSE